VRPSAFSASPVQRNESGVTSLKTQRIGMRLAFANPVAGGYGFQFIDAETGATVGKGRIGSSSIEGWDMAFPDSDDPLIVAIADQVLFWCRYKAVVGLTKGITIKGGPDR